jgi:hypothetical protein
MSPREIAKATNKPADASFNFDELALRASLDDAWIERGDRIQA